MALKRPSGSRVSLGQDRSAAAGTLIGQLGEANMQRRALGQGVVEDGGDVGSQNAVWADRTFAGASGGEFIVSHSLGEVPSVVELVSWRPQSDWIVACGTRPETWTESTVRVKVWTGAANLDGLTGTFRVSGR